VDGSTAKRVRELLRQVPSYAYFCWARQEANDDAGLAPIPMPRKLSIGLAFGEPGFGFGEFTFVQDLEGQVYIDTECTSRKTLQRMLSRLLESAIFDTDQDPERHRKYNANRGRRCARSCAVCFPPEAAPNG